MPIAALPTPGPSTSDPTTFDPRADALVAALPTFITDANALEVNVNAKEVSAVAAAAAALASETDAETAAANAIAIVGATKWVSGTTYAIGNCTWSPTDYKVYRRKTAGAGTTDPLYDTTNWVLVAYGAPDVAIIKNPLAFAQGVELTSATSGSTGIQNIDNANLNVGTGNLSWAGFVYQSDWTPAADQIIVQKHDGTNGWILKLLTTGILRLTINATNYDSTVANTLTNATVAAIGFSMTRELPSTAGVVRFVVNGVQWGADVAMTAGTPITITNAVSMYTMGTSSVRTAGRIYDPTIWNRALTIAEHWGWIVHGVSLSDMWGSQTILNTASWVNDGSASYDYATFDGASATAFHAIAPSGLCAAVSASAFSATIPGGKVSVGDRFLVTFTATLTSGVVPSVHLARSTASSAPEYLYSNVVSISAGANAIILTANHIDAMRVSFKTNGAVEYAIADFAVTKLGAIVALESEGIQPAPGQWLDSSTNKLHAMQPTAGSSLVRRKKDFEIRWTNTWAASHEAQYIGGVNQAILPANCYIDSIIGVISGATIEDIIVGDGSDTDRWVTITTGLAAGTVSFAVANKISDGTNYKMTVDPDANFTGSITWTIRGTILQ